MRYAINKDNEYHQQVAHLIRRAGPIQSVAFNLNASSNKQCLVDFHFLKKDIMMLASLIGWDGVMKRNEHKCRP